MSDENAATMPDMKLELVPVPVSDVDRAKSFYVEKVGFNLDHDVQSSENMRVVQLTPPGSACSIVIGTDLGEISEMKPGSVKALHLIVEYVKRVGELLAGRGVGRVPYSHLHRNRCRREATSPECRSAAGAFPRRWSCLE